MQTAPSPIAPEAVGVVGADLRVPRPEAEIPGLTDAQRAYIADLKEAKMSARRYAVARLVSLRDTGKHVYRNTVPAKVVARRRKRAKIAKASRKANR